MPYQKRNPKLGMKGPQNMATRKEKVMSERDVVENGEDEDMATSEENGWLSFTLSSSHPDYDIPCRLRLDGLQGIAPQSAVKLMSKQAKHILSNERSSAGKTRNVERFPDREAFERSWALAKREAIVNGEYAEGGRNVGPRIAPIDKVKRELVIADMKKEWTSDKPFPTSGKAEITGRSLDEWIKLILAGTNAAHYQAEAERIIAERDAAVAAAKARAAAMPAGASPFASLV